MVLFENADFLALDKPPGLSMATPPSDRRAESRVVETLLSAAGDPRRAEGLLLVHRLDVGTSGVVLIAKNPEAQRAVAQAIAARRAHKTYRALVWGHPEPPEGAWEDPLGRDRDDGRRMAVRAGGKASRTRYRVRAASGPVSDVHLFPETGRTHQIRVHAAAHGHPIAGDDLYGGGALWTRAADPMQRRALAAVARPLLHAERLELPEAELDVAAPLPTDYVRALEAFGIAP